MPILLLAVFILVPIAELYVIIQIGGAIGIIPTLFLLVLDSILGTILLRSQGRSAWVAFNRALTENRVPAKEIIDGVLIILGGALLLTPGFLTDIVGLILLIPPTRAIVRAFARRFVIGRFAMGPRAAMWGYGQARDRSARRPGPPPRSRPRPSADRPAAQAPSAEDFGWPGRPNGRRPGDIEGTAEEVRDEDSLPPGERGTFPG
jgi:UPF0716 protein FxsA